MRSDRDTAAPFDIYERTGLFADRCIKVAMSLPNNGIAWELSRQLVRSAGSVGANLEECKGAISKPQFRHKVSISLAEARETLYWINRVANGELLPWKRLTNLIKEADEIVSVLTTILKNSRRNQEREKS